MKKKPHWLSWSSKSYLLPDTILSDVKSWRKTIDWFLSGPHLHHDREASRGYENTELWSLGMGLIVQNLIRLYAHRDEEEFQQTPMMEILRLWICESDAKAKTVLQRTRKILQVEYLQDHANRDRIATPGPATVPEGASERRNPPRSVTRSRTSSKREREVDDVLPSVPKKSKRY